jgi:hypothetical protein
MLKPIKGYLLKHRILAGLGVKRVYQTESRYNDHFLIPIDPV